MKIRINTHSIAMVAIIFFSVSKIEAQETNKASQVKTTISLETDPSTFAFEGYALHIRIKPKNSRHLLIGAGTYGMDMPDFLINMNADNKDKEWNVRINSAFSLFGEYYFLEANSKWFLGLQAGVQNYTISNNHIVNKRSKFSNVLIMPSIGYNWQPFNFPLYIKPWFGVGYTSKHSGSNSIEKLKYNISPLVPFVTLHVGYTFNK